MLNYFDSDWIHSRDCNIVAWVFAGVSILISLSHVAQHLMYFTMPGIQIYVIRILLITPIYSLSSALAIQLGNNGLYAETIRDIYEAFVLYSFLNLIMEFCGGETDCVYQIGKGAVVTKRPIGLILPSFMSHIFKTAENDPPLTMPFPLCFLGTRPRDARLMRFCQRGVLQVWCSSISILR
jgi:Organic solute transporter Ostalpha